MIEILNPFGVGQYQSSIGLAHSRGWRRFFWRSF